MSGTIISQIGGANITCLVDMAGLIEPNAVNQLDEPRIRSDVVEERLHIQISQKPIPLHVSLLQPLEHQIGLAHSSISARHLKSRNIFSLGGRLQLELP